MHNKLSAERFVFDSYLYIEDVSVTRLNSIIAHSIFAKTPSSRSPMNSILRAPYDLVRPLYERSSFHRSVIEELPDTRLQTAYTHCRCITRDYAKTFYMATRFLPNEKQRSIFAIYTLCRYVDNLVDDHQDLLQNQESNTYTPLEKLDSFKETLAEAYEGRQMDDPVLTAITDSLLSSGIPLRYPLELISGVEMDLVKNRYQTFEEVYDYSYKVASVVGLMTSEVFGYKESKALSHAVDLGIAMQLTNILRDVGEDLNRDRIYLAKDELEKFDLTEADLFQHNLSEKFIAFMKFQIERTQEYYESAKQGVNMLSRDSRLPVWLALENYSRILTKIEQNGYDVFSQRAHLTSAEKFSILPRILYRLQRA